MTLVILILFVYGMFMIFSLAAYGAYAFWRYAPYVLTCLFVFFWGPHVILKTDAAELHWGLGLTCVLITIPVIYIMTKLPQLILPYFLMIYTLIFAALPFADNIFLFTIIVTIVVGGGVLTAYDVYGGQFWDNQFSNNRNVKIIVRIISTSMYWYSILVLECLLILAIDANGEETFYVSWLEFYRDTANIGMVMSLPYAWISFIIAGTIGFIGLILDLRYPHVGLQMANRVTEIVRKIVHRR